MGSNPMPPAFIQSRDEGGRCELGAEAASCSYEPETERMLAPTRNQEEAWEASSLEALERARPHCHFDIGLRASRTVR